MAKHYNVTTHNPVTGINTTTTMLLDNTATLAARVALSGHRLNDAVLVDTIDIDNDLNVGGSVGRFDPNGGLFNKHAGNYVPTLPGAATWTARLAEHDSIDGDAIGWTELLHRTTLTLTRQRAGGHRKADKGHDAHKGFAAWSRAVATPGTVAKGNATQQRATYAAHIDESVVWDSMADTLLDRHVRTATETPAITDDDLATARPSPCTAQAVIGLSRAELARRASGQRDVITGKNPHRATVTVFVLDDEQQFMTTAKVYRPARYVDATVALGTVAQPDASLVALEQHEEVAACIAELPDTLRMTALNAMNGGGIPDSVPRNVYYKRVQRMRELLSAKFRARGLMTAD